tara:strand:- start:3581 stop:4144 length:564 start_codon:yes stop_codon:yes gene_type:complete
MGQFINESRFMHALAYASEPYSISPMCDRWFNQLAVVQLEGQKDPIHLTGEVAIKYVDIVINGEIIPKDQIVNVRRYYSPKSNYQEYEEKLLDEIGQLQERRPLPDEDEQHLQEMLDKLDKLTVDKKEANDLYNKIVDDDSRPYPSWRINNILVRNAEFELKDFELKLNQTHLLIISRLKTMEQQTI